MKTEYKHQPPIQFYIIKAMREDIEFGFQFYIIKAMREDIEFGFLRLFHVREVLRLRKMLENDKNK